ncbi:RNA polymerase sigma factor [Amycolatopsis australiensis]|uniref:RNA polymerase sigma factor n=1 Tax=Amycolatopsis australiensis TaxID=546364 RepID=UPI000931D784|nr:sigma factor-like helix-turn-helix DNA-binding protein [Amycolatopsis australiensis]
MTCITIGGVPEAHSAARGHGSTASRRTSSRGTGGGGGTGAQALGADLDLALAALRPRERDVLLLVAVEGLAYQEVAEALPIPVGTVKSRLNRARHRVRARGEVWFSVDGKAPIGGADDPRPEGTPEDCRPVRRHGRAAPSR